MIKNAKMNQEVWLFLPINSPYVTGPTITKGTVKGVAPFDSAIAKYQYLVDAEGKYYWCLPNNLWGSFHELQQDLKNYVVGGCPLEGE